MDTGKDALEIARLASNMVKIPSVSSNVEGVAEMADFVSGWLKKNGISAEVVNFEEDAPVVIAEVGSGRKTILLNGHMDVVPEGNRKMWRDDPYSGKLDGKGLYGRGAVDMKGGLATLMHTFAEVADSTEHKVIFTAVPDEEVGGGKGARHLAEKYRPNLVLLGEPSGSKLIGLGEKGHLQITLVGKGKTAHASLPSLGSNAIMKVVRDIDRLSRISSVKVNVPDYAKPMLQAGVKELGADVGTITFNPGKIKGGLKMNVVPDHCEVGIDIRLPPGIAIKKVVAIARSMVKETEVRIDTASEPNVTKPSVPEVAKFIKAVKAHCPDAKQVIKNGATDGCYFRYRGVPVVGFGPGKNELTHSYNEYVSLKEINIAHRVYYDFLV